ncbi:VWA domain-containing protein [bacterium]|nr:VWA domain-containing protein [bacterium]
MKRVKKVILIILMLSLFSIDIKSIKAEEMKAKKTVAVLDFKNVSNSGKLDYLQNAIPEMLITDLLISKKIKVVEREKLKKVLEELKFSLSGTIAPEKSIEIGKMTGATALLMGSIIKIGYKMRIDARLIDIRTSEVILAEKVEFNNEDEVIEATDRLAEKIIKSLTGEEIKIGDTEKLPPVDIKSFQGKSLFMETAVNNQYRLQGSNQKTYLQIDLFAREIEKRKRIPLNVALVIDRSGSMASEKKMEYVKEAAKFVVNNLNREDILSIVTYESEVEVLFEAGKITNKKYILEIIDKIFPGGSTNLSGGMIEGYKQIAKNYRTGQVNRVLLLSDGLANRGITNDESLQAICQEKSRQGISISSFGVGVQFNEDLMLLLAEYGAGNYYYIDQPGNIANMFDKELKGLLAVVAQDVSLQIEIPKQVKLEEIYGYLFKQKGNKVKIKLNDVFAREKKIIILKLKVPVSWREPFRVARVILTYSDVMNSGKKEKELSEVSLLYTKNKKLVEQNENNYVGQSASLMESTLVMERAIKMVDKGKKKEAEIWLKENIAPLKDKVEKYNTKELKKQLLNIYDYQNTLNAPSLSLNEEKALQKREKYRQYEIQKSK